MKKIHNFLHRLLVVLRTLNTCVLDLCVVSVVWSVWVHGSSYGFLLLIGPGFIFEPVVNF
jgi:hypothetical protein